MSTLGMKNKAPSFVLYIISFTTSLTLVTAIGNVFSSFFNPILSSQGSTDVIFNGGILIGVSILSSVEAVMLSKWFGTKAFISSLLLETTRFYSLTLLSPSDTNGLFIALTSASFFSVFISKVLRKKVDGVINTPLSKNVSAIIPAAALIVVFASSTLLSVFGLAPVSQEANPQYFDTSNINFSLFNVPSWNAQYYLDNILDSFGAGLNSPFQVMFNVTNNSPDPSAPTTKLSPYLKDNTYFNYEYDSVKAKSGTFFPATAGVLQQNIYTAGSSSNSQINSQAVPNSILLGMAQSYLLRNYNAYSITVSKTINHTSLYSEILPAVRSAGTYDFGGTGNNFYGSYIDPNTVKVYGSDGSVVSDCSKNQGISSCSFTEDGISINGMKGVADVGLRLDGFANSANAETLNYTMSYIDPAYDQLNAYAMNTSYYSTLFSPATWNAIKTIYLQLPGQDGTSLPSGITSYNQWSPASFTIANQYNSSSASVMDIINGLMNAMSPGINFTSGANQIFVPSGNLGMKFNLKLWLTPFEYTLNHETPPHPDPTTNEEYVQWFLTQSNKSTSDGAVFSDFAAAMTMILREIGIPARFVTGYAYGNTSTTATDQPYRTVYQALHKIAWTEALVPLLTPAGPTFEWVTVDPVGQVIHPILDAIAGVITGTQKYELLDPFSYNQSTVLKSSSGQTNFDNSIFRVGVDQRNATSTYNNIYDPNGADTGVILSNGLTGISQTYGVVHVAVFVAKLNFYDTTLNYLTGAGRVPVTFKLATLNGGNPNSYSTRLWNNNSITSITTFSDPITSIAEVDFTYQDLNTTFGVVNGIGSVNFRANTTDPNSDIIINGVTSPLPGWRVGLSDTNRGGAQDTTIYSYFDPTIEFNTTAPGFWAITYSPHILKVGSQPFMESYTTIGKVSFQERLNSGIKVYNKPVVDQMVLTRADLLTTRSSNEGAIYFLFSSFVVVFFVSKKVKISKIW